MSSSDFTHDTSSLAAALDRVDPALDPTLPGASSDHGVLQCAYRPIRVSSPLDALEKQD